MSGDEIGDVGYHRIQRRLEFFQPNFPIDVQARHDGFPCVRRPHLAEFDSVLLGDYNVINSARGLHHARHIALGKLVVVVER